MPTLAVIGAGGVGFPLQLIGDILTFPELRDSSPAPMNLDARRNDRTAFRRLALGGCAGWRVLSELSASVDEDAHRDNARFCRVFDAQRQDLHRVDATERRASLSLRPSMRGASPGASLRADAPAGIE